jgi:hypothetical protein
MTIPRNLSFLAEGASSTGVLSVAKGGTGLTTLTAGYIPYGNGTGAFNSSSNLQFDGTNLGIGTASPNSYGAGVSALTLNAATVVTYDLNIGGTRYGAITGLANELRVTAVGASSVNTFYTNGSERMRVFASGGVSIGNTTDPGASNLSVSGNVIANNYYTNAVAFGIGYAASYPYINFYGSAGNIMTFGSGATEWMRMFSSGGVSIGNTSDPGAKNLSVSGTVQTQGYTVATLPTGVTGMRAYVTNALAPSYGSTVVGGGSVTIPVFYNGTNWIVA